MPSTDSIQNDTVKGTDYSGAVVVGFCVVLALGVRLAAVALSEFPLNDGGLFYSFIQDVLAHGLRLPVFSSYNNSSIPLVYPPLAFYLVAILHLAAHLSLLQILQFAPTILSVISIPAFYLLAVELSNSPTQAALATLAFSLIPRAFDWLIMGGGITRSLGLLFALLVMRQAIRLFVQHSTAAVLPAILFGSLLVCSHPEATVHAALTAALLYVWSDRSKAGLRNAGLVSAGILIVASPWWLVVLTRHGLDPFLAAASAARVDSYNPLIGLVALFRFEFTDEPYVMIFAVLGLIGMLLKLARRDYFLPVWFVLMHTFEPRGGTLFMMIPLALAVGFSLDTLVLPALRSEKAGNRHASGGSGSREATWLSALLQGRGPQLFLSFLVLYGSFSAYAAALRIQREFTLTSDDVESFTWIRQNAPADGRFALITEGLPLRDASSDWFPALTERTSISTVFGTEWLRSVDFAARGEAYRALQECATQNASCLGVWAAKYGQTADYVYVRDPSPGHRSALREFLSQAAGFSEVYANQTLTIYEWK